MDFITIAKQRMSVRDYKETKVEPEKLEQILEAAHVAPTAANLQPSRCRNFTRRPARSAPACTTRASTPSR